MNRSVCQKKGGAGGNFTWTGARKHSTEDADVPADYVPTAGSNDMPAVSVAARKVQAQNHGFARFQLENTDFPALGHPCEAAERTEASAFWKHAVREDADLIPAM